MKSFSKLLGAFAGVSLALTSLGCYKHALKDTALPIQEETQKETLNLVEKVAENEYNILVGDKAPQFDAMNPGLEIYPETKTGQTANLYIDVVDQGENAGLALIFLYEDDKEIYGYLVPEFWEQSEWCFNHQLEIKHEEPGLHEYRFKVVDKGGNEAIMTKSLEFTGEPLDLPPRFSKYEKEEFEGFGDYLFVDPLNNGLQASVHDYGDNPGISEINLYQDGQLVNIPNISIHFDDPHSLLMVDFSELVESAGLGEHTYYVEAVDIGGNVTRTETVTLHFE